jgi:hypothetical protein
LGIEPVHLADSDLDLLVAAVEILEDDLVRLVVQRVQSECRALDTGVQVLADEVDLALGVAAQMQGAGENAVVGDAHVHGRRQVLEIPAQHYQHAAAVGEVDPLAQRTLLAEIVEAPNCLPGGPSQLATRRLELVQFLEDVEGDDHVALGKAVQGLGVVEEHVGIQDIGRCHDAES